jgi:SEC-C motif-containing protein
VKSSKSLANKLTNPLCPCESSKQYNACCQPYHTGLSAPTAEALMRSRYSAFVLNLETYLLQTWHPETRPTTLNLANDPPTKWLGLQVKQATNTSETTATVEFIARYKVSGKAEKLHEISQFVRIEASWYYLTGELLS